VGILNQEHYNKIIRFILLEKRKSVKPVAFSIDYPFDVAQNLPYSTGSGRALSLPNGTSLRLTMAEP
jgi:hypothetical protein